jgi:UDP-2,4-diacetamido-2,4,6-trideoxy-beta-L-altropyranose hydrolase
MFLIRITNKLDQGLGHLMRMCHLAEALAENNQEVHFQLDTLEQVPPRITRQFQCVIANENPQSVISYASEHNSKHIIIDSYSLPVSYETRLKEAGLIVTVIDDNERAHDCDYLIDYKWTGENTANRYEDLVPEQCQRLLGPDFCLLDKAYSYGLERQNNGHRKRVLMSLGGGGDLVLIVNLLSHLSIKLIKNIDIDIVVGPKALHKNELLRYAQQHNSIQVIEDCECLKPYYLKADLFIGALGTSFYECAVTSTPAITFSIGENQQNNVSILEWLGHYFHINHLESNSNELMKFANLVELALTNLTRLELLIQSRRVGLDGLGSKRIAAILCGQVYQPVTEFPDNKYQTLEDLTDNYFIAKVDDRHVNAYLNARSLATNNQKMTLQQKIPQLDHYLWWFKQTRDNYCLIQQVEKEQKVKLYIWHSTFEDDYLYGGWFTCEENIGLPLAMMILKWQLAYCKKRFPEATWLAVIHKENKFVNLLNQYMGFTKTPEGSNAYRITQQIFPSADNRFNFVMLTNEE